MSSTSSSGSGLQVPILAFLAGTLLLVSALRGQSIVDILAGVEHDPLDASGAKRKNHTATVPNTGPDSISSDDSVPTGIVGRASLTGTPKQIIDSQVLPIARKHGIKRTSAQNNASNATHGPTNTGGLSDHQGPPTQRWAADMSNGSSPTKEMDALAKELATVFQIPWSGSGIVSATHGSYRFQLIYRSNEGGNHFNHVHFGVAKA